jgi:TP901 family phage tail tape measure protein
MADYDLGTARGKIIIDADGAQAGIDQANQSIGNLASNQRQAGQTLQDTGRGLLVVGGAAVTAFGIAVNAAADFESQISAIEAVSQGTEDQMEKVREKALQLGADTAYSAGEAAGAMEELSRRGIDLEDILAGAADAAVNLAAATGTDLETAATVASNAMNIFGLSAEDLGNVTDKIAGFDVVGSSVEDFSYALQQAGAVANLVGLSFDDTTLAIAAMSKAGINGSDAGTSLKTMLNNLQPSTKKQITLARELGIITEDGANQFYNAQGQVKSMAEIAGVLSGALEGLTDQQKQQALETLFGSDAIRAAAVVAGEGAAGFEQLATQIGSVSAQDQAETRMDNLSGSLEQLKGSIETYLIGAGTPFLNSIRSIVDGLTELVNWFGNLPAPIQGMISKFILFAGIALVLAGSISFVLGTFLKFAATLKSFGALFGLGKQAKAAATGMRLLNLAFLANPVFLIIAALVALGVALFVLYKKSERFRKFVNGLWDGIKEGWEKAVDFVKGIPEFFENIFNEVTDFIEGWVNKIKEIFNILFKGDFTGVSGWMEDSGIVDFFFDVREAALDFINFWKDLPGRIGRAIEDMASAIADFFTSLPGVIAEGLGVALDAFLDFLTQLPERFAYFLGLVIGTYIRFQIDFWKKVFETGVGVLQRIIDFMTQIPGLVWDQLVLTFNFWVQFGQDLIAKVIEIGTTVVETLVNKFLEFVAWLPGFLLSIITAIIGFGADLVSRIISIGIEFVSGLINAIINLPGQVADILWQIITGLPGFAADMLSGAFNIGKSLVDGLISGVGDLVSLVKNMVANAINGIGDLGSTAYNKMKSVGSSMWNGFKSGLGINSPSYVEEAAFAMNENVAKAIDTLGNQVKSIQNLSRSMPGVDGSEQVLSSTASLAAVGGGVSTSTAGSSGASTELGSIQGPLIGELHVAGTEEEALTWSRRLADLTYKQMEAQGNRAARVNGAFNVTG